MSAKKQREYHYNPNTRQFCVRCNSALTAEIEALAAERRRSYSNTIRTLLYLGLETYRTNGLSGIKSGSKRKLVAAELTAKAEAQAAYDEAQRHGRVVPLLVPLDFEDDDDSVLLREIAQTKEIYQCQKQ